MLFLCGLSGLLFYLDRQIVPVLKPSLKAEMGWSDTDYGWLVTTFLLFYTTFYLVTGRWIDRWGTRRTMPFFLASMSVATILCGLGRNLMEMSAYHALLGVAEAGIMPAILVAIFKWFPHERRALAYTVKAPFNVVGQIAAAPLVLFVTRFASWRLAFFVPGFLGLLCAALWWRADSEAGPGTPQESNAVVSYTQILNRREIWGVIAAKFVSDPLWFFLLYWESGYLQEKLGMSLRDLGRIGWIPTVIATVVLISIGAFSDRLVKRFGWTAARSARLILQTSACLAPAVLALQYTRDYTVALFFLCLVRTMMIIWLNFTTLLLADLVPTNQMGRATGLMSALGAAMAMICGSIAGPLITRVGYGPIFAVGACLHPVGAFILWR